MDILWWWALIISTCLLTTSVWAYQGSVSSMTQIRTNIMTYSMYYKYFIIYFRYCISLFTNHTKQVCAWWNMISKFVHHGVNFISLRITILWSRFQPINKASKIHKSFVYRSSVYYDYQCQACFISEEQYNVKQPARQSPVSQISTFSGSISLSLTVNQQINVKLKIWEIFLGQPTQWQLTDTYGNSVRVSHCLQSGGRNRY